MKIQYPNVFKLASKAGKHFIWAWANVHLSALSKVKSSMWVWLLMPKTLQTGSVCSVHTLMFQWFEVNAGCFPDSEVLWNWFNSIIDRNRENEKMKDGKDEKELREKCPSPWRQRENIAPLLSFLNPACYQYVSRVPPHIQTGFCGVLPNSLSLFTKLRNVWIL